MLVVSLLYQSRNGVLLVLNDDAPIGAVQTPIPAAEVASHWRLLNLPFPAVMRSCSLEVGEVDQRIDGWQVAKWMGQISELFR